MAKKISEEDVQKAVAQVKHPAIDHTLQEFKDLAKLTGFEVVEKDRSMGT